MIWTWIRSRIQPLPGSDWGQQGRNADFSHHSFLENHWKGLTFFCEMSPWKRLKINRTRPQRFVVLTFIVIYIVIFQQVEYLGFIDSKIFSFTHLFQVFKEVELSLYCTAFYSPTLFLFRHFQNKVVKTQKSKQRKKWTYFFISEVIVQ